MDKKLKDTLKTVKKLHKKELIYLHDSIGLETEPNYQVLVTLVEELNLTMNKEDYDLAKNNKEEFIYELALLSLEEKALISEEDIEFMEFLIQEYVDTEDPILIEDTYVFTTKMDKVKELYDKALKQIDEGKFKNFIF
ncbi:MAG: hypothetical protein VB130_09735 [Clostridium sp.]|nr:hypothetical protein [Clostridium sp.]